MRDILPPSSAVWNEVESAARRIFARFNYREIRTPILEETALFTRSVGEETDAASVRRRDGTASFIRLEQKRSDRIRLPSMRKLSSWWLRFCMRSAYTILSC
jgi:histidyl-tRNA synthetase